MQNIRIFKRGSEYVTVPTSPAGSYQPSACSCKAAGGFDGDYSGGIVGCVPCRDGFYSAPGMPQCEECPLGTYSTQSFGLRDYYVCPASDSPAIRFSSRYPWKSAVSATQCTAPRIVVGASYCTPCPPDRPYTWSKASTTVDACHRCMEGFYFDDFEKTCNKCRPKCDYPEEYETHECTEDSDRVCANCTMDNCDPIFEYVDMEKGCDFTGNACKRCTNKPVGENSRYIMGAMGPNSCAWMCNEGFFSAIGGATCEQCTQFDSTSCPAGFVFSACSDLLHRDASCDRECDPIEHGKPVENSVWALATVDDNWNVVENKGQNSGPNLACLWKCADGYKKQVLMNSYDGVDGSNLSICVPDTDGI